MNADTTHCFHCQELLPRDNPQCYASVINNTTRYFCCPACATVADTIYNLGLGQYYRQRDEKPQRPTQITLSSTELEAHYQSALHVIDENNKFSADDFGSENTAWTFIDVIFDGVLHVEGSGSRRKIKSEFHELVWFEFVVDKVVDDNWFGGSWVSDEQNGVLHFNLEVKEHAKTFGVDCWDQNLREFPISRGFILGDQFFFFLFINV